jgi:poly-gamma-glutamate synthesis protein (capsule biosynthesis protein)
LDTLAMYRERGWKTFGGGATLKEAQAPLLIEDHGNRLAFLGCSPAGPQDVWATPASPGSAPCDFTKLEESIRELRQQGYLPVVTFQHVETDGYAPAVAQGKPDFRRMAAAGAAIVSGSQSHYAQTMTFVNDSFVHYGLGNLFFDQMKPEEIRAGFIDRHVFYDGRYLGVELLTSKLEDYALQRPMNAEERARFLETIFSLCNWHEE